MISTHFLKDINDISGTFKIIEVIGGGSFGTVYKAIHIRSNETKALKIGSKFTSPHMTNFNQEIKILRMINHPNIIRLHDVYESKKEVCLVLEYCPRELSRIFQEEDFLHEASIQTIMQYLTSAVAYLHANGIVHRDLKLENILIGENPSNPDDAWFVKLCDFSVSAIKQGTGYDFMLKEFCGTPLYMAPEMETESYSELCDIWALGIIMYLLFEGRFPFDIRNIDQIREVIIQTAVDFDSLKCSKAAVQLIQKCLQVNPGHRITAQEMIYSAWIQGKHIDENESQQNILLMMDEFNMKPENKVETTERSKTSLQSQNTSTSSTVSVLRGLPETTIKRLPIEVSKRNGEFPKIEITAMIKGIRSWFYLFKICLKP